jgi:hypothetical protein
MGAKVILIVSYADRIPWVRIAPAINVFGDDLLGLVVNEVPTAKVQAVRNDVAAAFDGRELKILGVLPEERALMGVALSELATRVEGKVVCCAEGMGKLVQNVMVGAFTPDSGVDYFSRKKDKVVVLRTDREDMQMAALNTSTLGLILTGGGTPLSKAISFAQEKKVPVLTTERDTLSTVDAIEAVVAQARFRQPGKPEKAAAILAKYFDLQAVGIPG